MLLNILSPTGQPSVTENNLAPNANGAPNVNRVNSDVEYYISFNLDQVIFSSVWMPST